MTNREKIIVGIMVLTVGYGAVELLLPRAKAVATLPVQSTEGLSAFIAKVADAVKGATAETSALVIQRAEASWNQDPFLAIRKPTVSQTPDTPKPDKDQRSKHNLVYSGFIDTGAKRLAIINGMEYEAGDRVASGGFIIKSVLPNKVIMVSSQGDGAPVVLPLQENE